MNEPIVMEWYDWVIFIIGLLTISAGLFWTLRKLMYLIIDWIRAKIKARKKKKVARNDELSITVTVDCSQAIAELEQLRFKAEAMIETRPAGIWHMPWETITIKEKQMPTRKEIENARDECLKVWDIKARTSNGGGSSSYYNDLCIKILGIKDRHLCAYCELFSAYECDGCPIMKIGEGCHNYNGIYSKWRDNPTRENALAMLEVVKHSLDHYFDEELIDIEPCICGNPSDGKPLDCINSNTGLCIISDRVLCPVCRKRGPSITGEARDGKDNDRIRAWNDMIRKERDKLPEVEDCICGTEFGGYVAGKKDSIMTEGMVYVGGLFVKCENCGKNGPEICSSTSDRIRKWNAQICREREEKENEMTCCNDYRRELKGGWLEVSTPRSIARYNADYCTVCGKKL